MKAYDAATEFGMFYISVSVIVLVISVSLFLFVHNYIRADVIYSSKGTFGCCTVIPYERRNISIKRFP